MIKCISCGQEHENVALFCCKCGSKLEVSEVSKLICPICEDEYTVDKKYCPQDGHELVATNSFVRACTKCGKKYPKGEKFCAEDGEAILPIYLHDAMSKKTNAGSRSATPFLSTTTINYMKAPLWNRLVASVFDFIILMILSIPAYLMNEYWLSPDGEDIHIFVYLILLIPPFWFGLVKQGFGKGQSPGKKGNNLMLIHLPSNCPCTKSRSAGRWLVSGFLAWVPIYFLGNMGMASSLIAVTIFIEPIMIISRTDGRRVVDLLLGLQVINSDDFRERKEN